MLAGCATAHEEHEPAGIPYACADGRTARIQYENGGWFMRARAALDLGGRRIALVAIPPTQGLRYVSTEGGETPPMLWDAWGELARISTLTDGDVWTELTTCTRVRDGGGTEAAAEPAHH